MEHWWNNDEQQRSAVLTEEPTAVPLTPQVALRLIPRLCGDNSVGNGSGYICFLSRLYFTRSKGEFASS
jgi:hypothetical protein